MTLSPDRPFLISPPFGSYFRSARAYSVLGSYTENARPGRTRQVLQTVRPVPGGWINKIGLRNPGWDSLSVAPVYDPCKIVSFALIDGDDREWVALTNYLVRNSYLRTIEVNVSCPNTDHPIPALPSENRIRKLLDLDNLSPLTVIWKLPPLPSSIAAASRLAGLGARHIHMSNTLPSPIGGISGAALREVNLPLVESIARFIGSPELCEVIAGGGIYSRDHVRQYRDAGATRFSLATAFFWPPLAYSVIHKLEV